MLFWICGSGFDPDTVFSFSFSFLQPIFYSLLMWSATATWSATAKVLLADPLSLILSPILSLSPAGPLLLPATAQAVSGGDLVLCQRLAGRASTYVI